MWPARSPFHRGEKEIHSRLGLEEMAEKLGRRKISGHLSDKYQAYFSRLPLLIVDTIDATGGPCASLATAASATG